MKTPTEKEIRYLKAAIARETNPLRKSNLKFRLSGLIREMARRNYEQKASQFAGNAF